MPRHLHSADIEYLWALALIIITFVRKSTLLALNVILHPHLLGFLAKPDQFLLFNSSVVFLAAGIRCVESFRPFAES